MDEAVGRRQRWVVLLAGFVVLIAACAFQYGLPYLIPGLREQGLTLAQAGTLVACPIAGLLTTLLLWGAAADRWGERAVLTAGPALGGLILLAGLWVGSTTGLALCFLAAGGATAAVHAASGRLILGWFPAHLRGRAMAIRQTAQPIGIALAALVLPGSSVTDALTSLGISCVLAALLAFAVVRDPARTGDAVSGRKASPYRGPVLWRIHATSALLVVPQFAVATFGLVYLVDERSWSAHQAGQLLAVAALGGAVTRLAAGYWSDRVGSRLGPLRTLAVGIGLVMLALTAGALRDSPIATAALLVASAVTISTNGLAFTAVAEHAGRSWAGRALGVQNTAQNAVAAATSPIMAAIILPAGYGIAFGLTVAFPLAAWALVPAHAEHTGAP